MWVSDLLMDISSVPYGIDIFYWFLAMAAVAILVMKLPVGMGCGLGFLVSGISAFLILFHLSFTHEFAGNAEANSKDHATNLIETVSRESVRCHADSAACEGLQVAKAEVVTLIEGKRQDAFESMVFTLLTNFTIMTLGGVAAGLVTTVMLRRTRADEDEAEESAMRVNSRGFILGLFKLLLVMVSAALLALYVKQYLDAQGVASPNQAAFHQLWSAGWVSLAGYAGAYFFYNGKPYGRVVMYIVFLFIACALGLYLNGIKHVPLVVSGGVGWPTLFIVGVPLITAVWLMAAARQQKKLATL